MKFDKPFYKTVISIEKIIFVFIYLTFRIHVQLFWFINTFIKPENILVSEDAPNGVKGANYAGMEVVMVPDPELPMSSSIEEVDAHPTVIIKSLNDFNFDVFEWGQNNL